MWLPFRAFLCFFDYGSPTYQNTTLPCHLFSFRWLQNLPTYSIPILSSSTVLKRLTMLAQNQTHPAQTTLTSNPPEQTFHPFMSQLFFNHPSLRIAMRHKPYQGLALQQDQHLKYISIANVLLLPHKTSNQHTIS